MAQAARAGCAAVTDRGPTYAEAHRHACEVRFVCSLVPSARRAYFDGKGDRPKPLAALRGEAAAGRLLAAVQAVLRGRRSALAQQP